MHLAASVCVHQELRVVPKLVEPVTVHLQIGMNLTQPLSHGLRNRHGG